MMTIMTQVLIGPNRDIYRSHNYHLPQSSSDSIRALRKVNVTLTEEMHSMRRVCAALDEQCRAANMRAQFKDDIIKEMRRQLKQAKAKVT